jgi:CheY-like chemotaxis protein
MTLRMNHPIALGSNMVLLVDDNAIQAATRQTVLKRAGYSVETALNPARALEMLHDHARPMDVGAVITDHIMPGMNGAEFVRELRKTMPLLPIIVISGLEEAEDEYEGLDVRFLLKPLPPDQLIANVRDVLQVEQQGAA